MIPLDHFSEEPGCRAGLSKKARNKHEELNRKLYISKDGYMEAFLVNETSENVWFDQFRIETTTPVILQETHYDPWGVELQGLGYQEPGSKVNKYLYNGKEFNDHQGLNLFDYGARLYDAAVGRWFTVDPLAELPSQIAHSPYVYAWNNPVGMIDPTGMAAEESDPGKKGKKGTEDPPPGWIDEKKGIKPMEEFVVQGVPDFVSMHLGNYKSRMGWEDEKGKQGGTLGTAIGLTVDWALGKGDDNRTFVNDAVANSFRDARVVNQVRDFWYNEVNAGNKTIQDGVTNFRGKQALTGGNFGLTGLLAAGIDPMEQFVGSFTPEISSNGKVLTFTIKNTTSFKSLMYGVAPDWSRSTWRPGGNMTQTYIFTEPINFDRLK